MFETKEQLIEFFAKSAGMSISEWIAKWETASGKSIQGTTTIRFGDLVDNEKEQDVNNLVEPAKLTITRRAFDNVSDYKKGILKQVAKRAVAREFEKDPPPNYAYLSPSPNIPTTIIWHFTQEEFLKVTSEFPWLLDSNLGEQID